MFLVSNHIFSLRKKDLLLGEFSGDDKIFPRKLRDVPYGTSLPSLQLSKNKSGKLLMVNC